MLTFFLIVLFIASLASISPRSKAQKHQEHQLFMHNWREEINYCKQHGLRAPESPEERAESDRNWTPFYLILIGGVALFFLFAAIVT